jgi:hypothetical protein
LAGGGPEEADFGDPAAVQAIRLRQVAADMAARNARDTRVMLTDCP